jgi:hypothetical protein
MNLTGKLFFASWATLTVLSGSALTSFHQPFRSPSPAILRLAEADPVKIRGIHIIASTCACSQRVMRHLIERKPLPSVDEQVLILDGPSPDLPETSALAASLIHEGFQVRRVPSASIPPDAALRGVPLLLFAAPDNSILYMGGYGPNFNQDAAVYARLQQKQPVAPLPATGCAVSRSLQRRADPFHLKY